MTLAIWFWLLMVVFLLFGIWVNYSPGQPFTYRSWGGMFLFWVLLGILGWAQFGAPVH